MMNTTAKSKEEARLPAPPQTVDLRPSFKQLERRIKGGLLLAFIAPLLLLSAYFHIQFHTTLKEAGKKNLAAIAESQRNTVDLFLQERLVNIFSLFHSSGFDLAPEVLQMEKLLRQLRQASDAFIDVGFLNHEGIQSGYAGPYGYLQNKDYSDQQWFTQLIQPGKNYTISDIYLGFRNKLHFTIAAKQIIDGQPYILRATLDPDKFYLFLATIQHGQGVESAIINRHGRFQLADPRFHEALGMSDYVPPLDSLSGADVIQRAGESVMTAHAWLSDVHWALLVYQPLRKAYAQLYRVRQIMLAGSSIVLAAVVAAIWFTTRKLIGKAWENAQKRQDLHYQLLHVSKLASVGELATGVAHEINNPLAIILATTGVIKDMLNPEFKINHSPEEIAAELNTIDQAVLRARGITQQLLDFGRKNPPQMVLSDVNAIIEEVLSGLRERTLALENVTIERHLQPDLPAIEVDHDQLRQVFLNLINNAGDAIAGAGTIAVTTQTAGDVLRITFADNGCGMTSDKLKKIFDPFYTTKEVGKGTGLGLSVSIGIIESMGGSMEVQSMPGAGSAFTIILPLQSSKGVPHEQTSVHQQKQRQPESVVDR
jgi:two-component system, NtrC family, sensor kinase